ncbi:D-2-hydroxyacid dehydrogenase [Brevifollis gellanilyticus]|uniref:Glycerate dehydrogenase n=1 Tax=Brevifollis gellanilyticus TaxID=748831 RepID=A0A512M7X2_9BACT|nr:D-2-hydroxyacid dehydrogenase [Brevifollis gellanilyticus]GEP42832.1 glycerate dehydrogenase [Brevifollis gellanilyticus]
MKIVLLDAHTANPGDVSWSALEAIAPCEIYPRTPLAETVARCADAEIVITNKAPLTREIIGALPKLKYIGVTATGYNIVDVAAAKERGIVVANVPGYGSPAVAQLVFALLLELANHVGHHARTVREGRWAECPDFSYWDFPVVELQGRTLGIIGYGDIGSSVARIALGFGMKVLASKREWKTPPPEGVTPASIDEVFAQSDAISLHCPLTDATKHLVNERTLGLMKSSAFLINTGRGPLIDEEVLAKALNEGRIAGAGLDVLSVEPPKPGHPLFTAKNCLITPHIGWASREARVRLIDATASNLRAFLDGKPVNVVG